MKYRTCGCCGSKQGPFDREFVGFRKTGVFLFTCKLPVRDADGRRVADSKRREAAMLCSNRREKRYAAAP